VRAEAKDGNRQAQMVIGTAYLQGNLGLPQNLPNAHHWFLKAAAQGDADAMNNVGLILYRGALGKTDLTGAKDWFEKAVRGGNTNAMISLARMHELGELGRRDAKKALGWLLKAAEANNQHAIVRLVAVYRNGELDQQVDPKRVAYWEARLVPATPKDKP
jgi:TPR repeat protein